MVPHRQSPGVYDTGAHGLAPDVAEVESGSLASPADCQAVYEGLTSSKEEYIGAVFDWQGSGEVP